jgi:cell division protein FtsQ
MDQLTTSPAFEATSVMAAGNDLLPAEEIVQAMNVGRPNVFWIRSHQLEIRLEQLPAIQTAAVRPSLSGSIYVNVKERAPVAVWDSEGQQVLTDVEGTALREGSRDLPILHGNVGGPIPIGGRLDASAIQAIQIIAPRLRSLGLEEARLEWTMGQGLSVLDDGQRVIFGSSDQIEAKLAAYQAIRERLDSGRIGAELIDVRSLDRPYFR